MSRLLSGYAARVAAIDKVGKCGFIDGVGNGDVFLPTTNCTSKRGGYCTNRINCF